jgi:DHA2 family multidrug resistance protein
MAGMNLPLRSKLLVLTAVLASLLEIIDTSIVNVAVPSMMGNLGTTLDEISWVVTGYIIANAIILPIAGWLSEQIGRKVYYTGCIALFTLSSVACGLAPNLPTLVLFRIIQGLAGGALLPTSQALIYEAFPKEQAGMGSAIYGMSVMVGPTVGPVLGGYLTDHLGWRSIFNINLPVGIIVMVLSWVLVEDLGHVPAKKATAEEVAAGAVPAAKRPLFKPKSQRTPVDSIGLMLLVLSIGCLQFVLERGHAEDWFDSKVISVCTVVGVISLIALIIWELKTEHPILDLRLFKNVNFRSGVLLMAGLGAMLYGLLFMVPVFASTVTGLTATQIGELFIPGALLGALCMPFIGAQLRKRDPRSLIFIGIVLLSFAMFEISRFNSQTSVAAMFQPLLIRGIALSFLFVPINTTVLTQFSGAKIGQAAGLMNLCRQLGGSISIALLSTLFQEYQVQYFSVLSSRITWFDVPAVQAAKIFGSGIHAKMVSVVGMSTMPGISQDTLATVKLLLFRAKREAFVLGYQRALLLAVCAFSLTLIPLYMMKRPAPIKGPLPDAH